MSKYLACIIISFFLLSGCQQKEHDDDETYSMRSMTLDSLYHAGHKYYILRAHSGRFTWIHDPDCNCKNESLQNETEKNKW